MADEKRLIDANALMEKAHWIIRSDGTRVFAIHAEDVEDAPTVDAVEVVRCKDCKQFIPFVEPYHNAGQCRKMVGLVGENDFCSYGERRKDG